MRKNGSWGRLPSLRRRPLRDGVGHGASLLHDHDCAAALDHVLDLGLLVPAEDDEALRSVPDAAVLGEGQLEALEALQARALADELVCVRVASLRLRSGLDALVDLTEERLVLGQPPLAELRHLVPPGSEGTTSSNRAPCGWAGS
jgi:hypothetical protein